jgi:hypothetical protein
MSASHFLSKRSVPKEQSKIARHFNAGKGLEKSSPAGTVEKKPVFAGAATRQAPFSAVPTGLDGDVVRTRRSNAGLFS